MSQSEELLVQLLDGALSEADRLRLEQLLAQDSSLAEEVRELQQVENLLTERAELSHSASADFRTRVLQNIQSQSGAAAGKAAGVKTAWIAGGAVILLTVAALLWFAGDNTAVIDTPPAPEAALTAVPTPTIELNFPPDQSHNDRAQDYGTIERDVEHAGTIDGFNPGPARTSDQAMPQSGSAADAPDSQSVEIRSDSETPNSNTVEGRTRVTERLEKQLRMAAASLREELQRHHQQGDAAREATTAHRLGGVYAHLGDVGAAATQYERAHDLAVEHGLRALEVQCTADLALLNATSANRDATEDILRNSIEQLRKLGRDTKDYEKALEELPH